MKAVVFGVTGNVGYGAALALLDAGATVIAPTRDAERAEALRAEFAGRTLEPVVGTVSDAAGADALRTAIGPVDHVVASIGPWWQRGRLTDQPSEAWDQVRAMMLDGHIHAARAFLPDMRARPGASYTIITGMGAHHYVPDTSLLFVACGAVLSLSRVLRAEHAEDAVRVNEVLISARIERAPRDGVVPSAVFGDAVAALVASDVRGEVVAYPGPDGFALPTAS